MALYVDKHLKHYAIKCMCFPVYHSFFKRLRHMFKNLSGGTSYEFRIWASDVNEAQKKVESDLQAEYPDAEILVGYGSIVEG